MDKEEIAKKLCRHNYTKLCSERKEMEEEYSYEEYWETNREYFMERAQIYLEVKECLEAK
jgi:predicted transglutaminase-like protease